MLETLILMAILFTDIYSAIKLFGKVWKHCSSNNTMK